MRASIPTNFRLCMASIWNAGNLWFERPTGPPDGRRDVWDIICKLVLHNIRVHMPPSTHVNGRPRKKIKETTLHTNLQNRTNLVVLLASTHHLPRFVEARESIPVVRESGPIARSYVRKAGGVPADTQPGPLTKVKSSNCGTQWRKSSGSARSGTQPTRAETRRLARWFGGTWPMPRRNSAVVRQLDPWNDDKHGRR